MAWRSMLLLRGVSIDTLYKLFGSIIIDGCNSSIVHWGGNKEYKTLLSLEKR